MSLWIVGLLLLGFVLVTVGADVFVAGAAGLARRFRVSSLTIGLTIVAFGTSAPEIAVNVTAAFQGQTGLAVGNVVGSNIFNVLCVLGLSALFAPLVVSRQVIRIDVPIMVAASVLLLPLAWDGLIGLVESAALLAGAVGYTVLQVHLAAKARAQESPVGEPPETGKLWVMLAKIAVGLVLLVLGSRWMVEGASTIARALGVSDLIIGLTIIAAGTSLPELATSVMATLRGERDLAVGNVVGSSLYNILGVLGVTGVVSGRGVPVPPEALRFDLPVMVAAAVACLPVFFTGHRIDRWEGAVFLGYYVVYLGYLVLSTLQHPAAAILGDVVLTFVLPLTVLTLGIFVWRSFRPTREAFE